MDKLKEFRKDLSSFENKQIKKLATLLIENAEFSFFTAPYSTTGKYIAKLCRGEGGLVRHTRAVFYIVEHERTPLIMMGDITKREGELLMVAALAQGMGRWLRQFSELDSTPENHEVVTRKMLPPLAVQYLEKIYEENRDELDTITRMDIDFIKRLILVSLGPWGTDKPVTALEKIFATAVHTATTSKFCLNIYGAWGKTETDYLIENIGDLRMTVGKYKDQRISHLYKADKQYLEWFAFEGKSKKYGLLQRAIGIFLQNRKDAEEAE